MISEQTVFWAVIRALFAFSLLLVGLGLTGRWYASRSVARKVMAAMRPIGPQEQVEVAQRARQAVQPVTPPLAALCIGLVQAEVQCPEMAEGIRKLRDEGKALLSPECRREIEIAETFFLGPPGGTIPPEGR